METERREGIEINIRKLLFACLDKWWLIVLCSILAAMISGLVTAKVITPKYKATMTFYVNNAQDYEKVSYISSANLSAAEQLVNTYIGILMTDTALEKVGEQAGGLSSDEVLGCLSAKQVAETVLFRVTVVHSDPVMALCIAQAAEEVMPDHLATVVEGSSTKVVDRPKLPEAPFSPNVQRNIMLGAALGGIFAVLLVVLLYMLDVRIKDEEDLNAISKYPVLGLVPEFESDEEKEGNAGKAQAKKRSKGKEAKK